MPIGSIIAAMTAAVAAGTQPNVLLIVWDDLGVDQAAAFGWTHAQSQMPVFEAICDQSVRFTDTWAMPECTPTRVALMTGRYPLRTRTIAPCTSGMVAGVQMNPAEDTLPKLLAAQGYATSMIGKYHLGENGPTGPAAPGTDAAFDYFNGSLNLPPSIDSTVGGQAVESLRGQVLSGPFSCGAPLLGIGACCMTSDECIGSTDPFDCLAMGGIPLLLEAGDGWVLAPTCAGGCDQVDFDRVNAYYRWTNTVSTLGDPIAEQSLVAGYQTTRIADDTIEWVQEQNQAQPWFCAMTFTASHTPLQPPPPGLSWSDGKIAGCALPDDIVGARQAFIEMTEAMDIETGRVLETLGLGSYDGDVFTLTDPAETNTWIIVLGDNGSLGYTVMPPFSFNQAKATPYQTGVWVPMTVAGPGVVDAGRDCSAMVNVVDLFVLVAELAGVDLASAIDWDTRPVDGVSIMPLLSDPVVEEVRDFNFADNGVGNFPVGYGGICVIGEQCQDYLLATAQACNDNGGTFYSYDEYTDCCDYADQTGDEIVAQATHSWTVRSADYKLIMRLGLTCPRETACLLEFYHLPTPVPPNDTGIESQDTQIDIPPTNPLHLAAFTQLQAQLVAMLVSEPYCLGDGNRDRRVDTDDLLGVVSDWGSQQVVKGENPAEGQGSFYDITQDGVVDVADLLAVIEYWTDDCDGSTPFPPTRTQQEAMGPAWNIPWYTEAPMECLLQTP